MRSASSGLLVFMRFLGSHLAELSCSYLMASLDLSAPCQDTRAATKCGLEGLLTPAKLKEQLRKLNIEKNARKRTKLFGLHSAAPFLRFLKDMASLATSIAVCCWRILITACRTNTQTASAMELEPLNKDEKPNDEFYINKYEETDAENDKHSSDKRDSWGSRFEFLLAIIGFTVGIGSIWRFPILCARNGGGAFLIPFFFFLFTCGGPLYYIEVSLGQFIGKSAGLAFELCPLFKGVGFLMVLISFDVMWYYVTIMGWIQYYFVMSFSATLPWTVCGQWWNTDSCTTNRTILFVTTNSSSNSSEHKSTSPDSSVYSSPVQEFWMHNVLRKSDGLEDMGAIQWHLVVSNFAAWLLIVLALWKGVKSLGKVVYVTATAPYVLLTILLIRGLTLDGAMDGVVWYLTPDFEKLSSAQVWLEAAIQVFYSLGPTYGGVITMASHNRFHQKSILETSICVVSDGFTAFYAGLVVFTSLGFMAKESGSTVEEVAQSSGPGLAFVAYPEALSRLPIPQFWAVLFFLTLITVVFDSAFGMFETVTGTIQDLFPKQLNRHKFAVPVATAVVLFLLSLPLSTEGGIYLFQLSDWYISAFALLLGSALEGIVVCWIYGADRFARDIELMTGRKSSVMLRVFWCIFMTGSLTVGFFITIATYKIIDYGDGYVFPSYAVTIGLFMSVIPIVPVPACMIYAILKTKGTLLQKMQTLLSPSEDWKPFDERAQEIYKLRPYVYEKTLVKRIKMNILGDKDTPWF